MTKNEWIQHYLNNVKREFLRYKSVGDATLEQLEETELHWSPNAGDNSIALIVKHLHGNMLSRWTNFLEEDGEKAWRDREQEFTTPPTDKKAILELWEEGWKVLFMAMDKMDSDTVEKPIKIRGEVHTPIEALNRQLAHYSSHVGQIVYLGKSIKGTNWKSPSIPKGGSEDFNKSMFSNNS